MKTLNILIFILFCYNVNAQKKAVIPKIGFEQLFKNKEDIKLTEVGDSIYYIKLELKKDAVVCGNPSVLLSKKFIFTYCDKVLQFDNQGRFIRIIGKIGKGPKEYIYPSNVSIDENKEQLFIHSNNKISVFSFNGSFINEFKVDPNYWKIEAINSNLFVGWSYISTGSEDNLFTLFDKNGTVISRVANYCHFPKKALNTSERYSNYNEFYKTQNKLYFKDMYTDTIYSIYQNKITPIKYLDLGKFKVPDNRRPAIATDRIQAKQMTKGFLWANIQETNKYIFINSHAFSENTKYLIFINNDKNISKVVLNDGFINDLDGGIVFWPLHIYNDQLLYDIIPANEFIKKSKSIAVQKESILVKRRKYFIDFASHISEEDNPIIVIVSLK